MARIFLCHASEDKAQVREVYHRLKALGFEPWLDEKDILPGQDWDYEIEMALEQSAFVMVFLSKRSVGKVGYVQREFRRAMYHSEEMPEGYIHTIPVKLDDCEVPRRFSRHQWVNLNDEGAFDRIVRALRYGFQQRGLPPPVLPIPSPTPPNTQEIELTIKGKFEEYTHEDQARLLRAISEFLKTDGIVHIKNIRKGSIKITLKLSPEQAKELLWAVKRGEFEAYGVIDAELKEARDHTGLVVEELAGAGTPVQSTYELESARISPPEELLLSDPKSRRLSVVTIVSLVIAVIGALAAVIVVPEVREWLGSDKPLDKRFADYYNMAVNDYRERNFLSAIENFEKALKVNPDHFGAYYNLGDSYRKIGDVDQSLSAFQKALELQPIHTKTLYNLATLYQQKGEDCKAREYYERVIELESERSELRTRAMNNLRGLSCRL